MADSIEQYGNNHAYTVVNATNTEHEWQVLQNRIASIDKSRVEHHLDEIYAIYQSCKTIDVNLEHINKMYGVMAYIQGRYSNLNELIDCTNEYTTHNAFIQLKYPELKHIDLDGVMIIGKTGSIVHTTEEPISKALPCSKEKTTAIKEVFN